MKGFENTAIHNGWAMAATGAFIVLCGLAVLSFVISQLHKILDFLANHGGLAELERKTRAKKICRHAGVFSSRTRAI